MTLGSISAHWMMALVVHVQYILFSLDLYFLDYIPTVFINGTTRSSAEW